MKRIATGVILFLLTALELGAQENNERSGKLFRLLKTAEEKMATFGDNTPELVANDASLLRQLSEFGALENSADVMWKDAMSELPRIAPSELSKTILFQSFEGLSADNYIAFLEAATDASDRNQISQPLLERAISPRRRLEGVIAYNYEDPRVRVLIRRWRATFSDNAKLQKWFDYVVSGKQRKWHDDYRASNPAAFSDRPPPVIGSHPSTLAPNNSPSPPAPTPIATPAPSSPASTVVESPASVVERKSPVWPWLVGILALVVIVSVALKRRA